MDNVAVRSGSSVGHCGGNGSSRSCGMSISLSMLLHHAHRWSP